MKVFLTENFIILLLCAVSLNNKLIFAQKSKRWQPFTYYLLLLHYTISLPLIHFSAMCHIFCMMLSFSEMAHEQNTSLFMHIHICI